jgi:hypothetical protein
MSHPSHGRPSPSRQRLAATVPRLASAGRILATAQPHPSHGRPSPRYPQPAAVGRRVQPAPAGPHLAMAWPQPAAPRPSLATPRPRQAAQSQPRPGQALAAPSWQRLATDVSNQLRPAAPGHGLAPAGHTQAQPGCAKATAGRTGPSPAWPRKKMELWDSNP